MLAAAPESYPRRQRRIVDPAFSPDSPHTSQEALALSIARAVQLGLPAPDSPDEIQRSVEDTLRVQARTNERLLGYARVVLLGGGGLLSLAVQLRPSLAGVDRFPAIQVGVTLAWALLAGALALVLARGWYRRWLRWAVPLLDALIILASFVLQISVGLTQRPSMPPGSYAIAGVACALLALTGALRLSRTAARLATGLAVLVWVVLAVLGRILWLPGVVIGALILVTGFLSSRIGRMVRRVIVDEVTRLRLVQMYRDAQAAIDAREEVLKIVSHDLRNPLGTIAMAVELILESSAVDEAQARHLGIIRRAGERMNRLVHDLLDAARIEAGRLPIEAREVHVADVMEAVNEVMGPLAADRSLRLVVAVPDGLPPVRVDPDRINQVFSNLVGNAIKFTPSGGRITLRAERMGDKIRFAVEDTGPGIPAHQLAEIFGRMWQASHDDTRGIGLGLTIAKAIVEAHGERIGVESRVGEGTEFWFTVPVAMDAAFTPVGEVPPPRSSSTARAAREPHGSPGGGNGSNPEPYDASDAKAARWQRFT